MCMFYKIVCSKRYVKFVGTYLQIKGCTTKYVLYTARTQEHDIACTNQVRYFRGTVSLVVRQNRRKRQQFQENLAPDLDRTDVFAATS